MNLQEQIGTLELSIQRRYNELGQMEFEITETEAGMEDLDKQKQRLLLLCEEWSTGIRHSEQVLDDLYYERFVNAH